ncbi:MAG: iron ABC transporter permease [Alphaproteobacteria bacterium]|nr:iron ABC transporter permease [Alphaproteobacteria bacterium]
MSGAAVSTGRPSHRRLGLSFAAGFVVVALVLVDISTGPGGLPLAAVAAALLTPDAVEVRQAVIVWDIRLPVALNAALLGGMLGLAGAQMQTILDNPLADPFTLGVSSAAGVGASLAIVTGLSVLPGAGPFLVSANAFAFAFAAALMVFGFSVARGASAETMILFGIALMFAFNALLAMLQYRASESQLVQIVFWMMGSLQRATPERLIGGLLVFVAVFALMWRRRWALTAMRFGDDRAASLGIDPKRLRLETLLLIALLSATAVSFAGVIGFIGLVGPHIARLAVGEDQRWFAPLSALAGAALLSAASIAAKTLSPGVIYPIGIVTALVGVPVFLSIVASHRRGVR